MKKFYPVLHIKNQQQAVEQATLLFENGADGLFLISHNNQDSLVVELARTFTFKFPETFKIGFNLLSTHPLNAMELAKEAGAAMIWYDNAGFDSSYIGNTANEISHLSKKWALDVFAGVAFKYQKHEKNPRLAAKTARSLGFIATTSGLKTGVGPDLQKVQEMAKEGPLAVASGLTVDNVREYAPYLTYFLVATGLSHSDYEFDEAKVRSFVQTLELFK